MSETAELQSAIIGIVRDASLDAWLERLPAAARADAVAQRRSLEGTRQIFYSDRIDRRGIEFGELFLQLERLGRFDAFFREFHAAVTGGNAYRPSDMPALASFAKAYVAREGLPGVLSDLADYCVLAVRVVESADPAPPARVDELTPVLTTAAVHGAFRYPVQQLLSDDEAELALAPEPTHLLIVKDPRVPITAHVFLADSAAFIDAVIARRPLRELVGLRANADETMSFLGSLQEQGMITWLCGEEVKP